MELSDRIFMTNRDWDPCYLRDSVTEDFYEFRNLWQSSVGDGELISEADKVEKYSPLVEAISLDDETLCSVVEEIEYQ